MSLFNLSPCGDWMSQLSSPAILVLVALAGLVVALFFTRGNVMPVHLPQPKRRFQIRSNFLIYMELSEKQKLAHYVAVNNTSMSEKCLQWIQEGWKRELEQESNDAE